MLSLATRRRNSPVRSWRDRRDQRSRLVLCALVGLLAVVLVSSCTASVELDRVSIGSSEPSTAEPAAADEGADTGAGRTDAGRTDASAAVDAPGSSVGTGDSNGSAEDTSVGADGAVGSAAPDAESMPDGTDREGPAADGDSSSAAPVGDVRIAETFEAIVDRVVFVEAGDATGTGFLIEGGWVLTNAHVVERLPEVRIGSADGRDLGSQPVHSVDWLFDIALVGPLDDAPTGFGRMSTEALDPGDGVLLVGFPDETGLDPTPTVTSGILSRRRMTAIGDHTFLQVDATIAPGQSGGALVDVDGNLLGVSTLEFGAGEFGVALAAETMWSRIDRLTELGPVAQVPDGEPVFSISDDVGPLRTFGFMIESDGDLVGDGDESSLLAVSDADVYLDVRGLDGFTIVEAVPREDPFVFPADNGDTSWFVDDLFEGGEELPAGLPAGTFEVVVGSFGESAELVEITSSLPIRRLPDIEEGAELPVGEIVEGVIDWSGDSDRWQLTLAEGDDVTITSDGISDTVLAVRLDGDVVAAADDEFIGLFGTAAKLSFVAPASGVYAVEVGTFDEARWGYLIEVAVS